MGVDVEKLAAALAQQLGASGLIQHPAQNALDNRTLSAALAEVTQVILAREGRGALSASTKKNTRLAFDRVLSAPLAPLTDAPTRRCEIVGADDGALCNASGRTYGRGRFFKVALRCSARSLRVVDQPEGDVSIEQPLAEVLGAVRICDLGARHVTIAWNALAGPSLSTYAASFVARLVEADLELGFAGLKRWREMWPTVPQPARRNIEVSPEIHREADACLRWAVRHTVTDEQTLRILAVAMCCPGRLGEICSLRIEDVDLRGKLLRLTDSKTGPGDVVLTDGACDLLRTQITSLGWDATWVWPRETGSGHARPDSVSKAWLRMRRAYAEERKTPEARALLRWRAHDFRGALATNAGEIGAPHRHVQRALRHKDARTTEKYMHAGTLEGPRRWMQRVEDVVLRPKKRGGS